MMDSATQSTQILTTVPVQQQIDSTSGMNLSLVLTSDTCCRWKPTGAKSAAAGRHSGKNLRTAQVGMMYTLTQVLKYVP